MWRGTGARTTGQQDETAVGYNATVASNPITIGSRAAEGGGSTAIGKNVDTGTVGNVHIIGFGAKSTGGHVVDNGSLAESVGLAAVPGHNAKATGAFAVAIGRLATAAANSTAIGDNAQATNGGALRKESLASHIDSVALGRSTNTSARNQLVIGPGHIAVQVVTAPPPNAAEGSAYLYFRSNEGKIGLYTWFPNSVEIGPIAVEK